MSFFQFSRQHLSWRGIWHEISEIPIKLYYLCLRCRQKKFDDDDVLEVDAENFTSFPDRPLSDSVVIAIHGSSSCPQQWRYSIPEFRLTFPQHSIILPNLSRKDLSFDDYVRFLDRLISLLIDNRIRISALIGTSMGGLLAAWMAEHTIPYNTKVITLNAPLQGAPALRFLPFKEKRYLAMHPDCNIISSLREKLKQSKHNYCCVVSRYDFHVPPEYGIAEIPQVNLVICEGAHTTCVIYPTLIWKDIRSRLIH